MLERKTFFVDNGHGWDLGLHRFRDPDVLRADAHPIVFVPGFAMNSFILGYHPTGDSIAAHLARAGLEVWCVDLRGQGVSRRTGARRRIGITDIGVVDLGAALDGIAVRTESERRGFDLVGCSLGATYVFMRATWGEDARIRRIINLGGPLRWTAVHKAVRTLTGLPLPWGALAMPGTRHVARTLLPMAARIPGFLHIYLHPAHCDLSDPATLTQVVDDPIPGVNATIARWIRAGDLVLDGRSLTADVAQLDLPLLTVVANADGIVPEATVCSAHNVMQRSPRRDVVYAGDHRIPMAHADLFISNHAAEQVFEPMRRWLAG